MIIWKKPLSVDEVTEKIQYQSTLDVVALKNSVMYESNEFMQKFELGRELMRIITEENIMKACLSKEKMEALEIFSNYEYEEWMCWKHVWVMKRWEHWRYFQIMNMKNGCVKKIVDGECLCVICIVNFENVIVLSFV